MPLAEFFADQFRQIRAFMRDPAEVVRIIRVDPDMRYVLIKALVKLDDEADNPHSMLLANAAFVETGDYFAALLIDLQQNYKANEASLEERGVRFVVPSGHSSTLDAAHQFRLYASALADALPDSMGSLVFVLDPEDVRDVESFRKAVEFLASQIASKWLKFIVLDSRVEPRLDGLERLDRIGAQTFHMPPDAIEKKLKEQTQQPAAADPLRHRRSLGVLAGFAFSKKDYDEAARLQTEWAALAESGGAPAEAASALYNLGNTLLEKGDLTGAEEQYLKCCRLCLEHAANGVLPLALTNLGVTLFRQNRMAEALDSLRVAHRHFKAQNHKPGEAFVYDTLGKAYHEQGHHDQAENAWLKAFETYDRITSAAFTDLRKSGCDDIRMKLERFYAATGRPNRIAKPHQPA
jgi:tetratricopeptide (TPR) repeat protein